MLGSTCLVFTYFLSITSLRLSYNNTWMYIILNSTHKLLVHETSWLKNCSYEIMFIYNTISIHIICSIVYGKKGGPQLKIEVCITPGNALNYINYLIW